MRALNLNDFFQFDNHTHGELMATGKIAVCNLNERFMPTPNSMVASRVRGCSRNDSTQNICRVGFELTTCGQTSHSATKPCHGSTLRYLIVNLLPHIP